MRKITIPTDIILAAYFMLMAALGILLIADNGFPYIPLVVTGLIATVIVLIALVVRLRRRQGQNQFRPGIHD